MGADRRRWEGDDGWETFNVQLPTLNVQREMVTAKYAKYANGVEGDGRKKAQRAHVERRVQTDRIGRVADGWETFNVQLPTLNVQRGRIETANYAKHANGVGDGRKKAQRAHVERRVQTDRIGRVANGWETFNVQLSTLNVLC
jgi:hypothetical protein